MSQPDAASYYDDYPTCTETFSTLRIFSTRLDPTQLTAELGVTPTRSFRMGESHAKGLVRKAHGWLYSTQSLVDSRDSGRHIDMLLRLLEGKNSNLKSLRQNGCDIDIVTFWGSIGQGGPALHPEQMLKLGSLGLFMWWEVYFEGPDEAATTGGSG